MSGCIDVEAAKLMEIINSLEQRLKAEYAHLTEKEREIKEKIISDLKQAWTNAVLYWNKHHHVSR